MWKPSWLEALNHDARHGMRLLVRSPLFTLFAVVSLALGIGATSAIFALFNAIVIRRLPVAEPDRLISASFSFVGGTPNNSFMYPQFDRMRALNTTLSGLAAFAPLARLNVAFRGEREIASGIYASGDYYRVLGIRPALGRLVDENDDARANTVAVISHACWQRRFGGRPDVIGAPIAINAVAFTIVGVEPSGFFGARVGAAPDITLPMRSRDLLSEGEPLWSKPFATWLLLIGRLKSGVVLRQAEQDLGLIFHRANEDAARVAPPHYRTIADSARTATLRLEPAAAGVISGLRDGYRIWLLLVLSILTSVLLLACLNLATLLLARSEARQREITTRFALGAGRWRIVRQLLTESALLAAIGGSLGLLLAFWGVSPLLGVATAGSDSIRLDVAPDVRVVAFVGALSMLTCLLFGLTPALRATSVLRPNTRQVGGPRRRWLDRSLVSLQAALSLVLLVFAGLFARSLQSVWKQDPGYDRRSVLMFSVDAGLSGKKGEDAMRVYQALLDEVRTMPGAASASASAVRPVDTGAYFVDRVTGIGGRALAQNETIRVAQNVITPGYFATLGVPLVAGRDFDDRDTADAPKVTIVSETMARRRFADRNPIGEQITLGLEESREIVGVVRAMRYARVKDVPGEVIYRPMLQAKGMGFAPSFELRYDGTAADAERNARLAVARVDPSLSPFRVKTLEAETRESLSRERLLAFLTSYTGGFALLLACIGVYGLISYAVVSRTPELGLRMALGASPAAVRWLVLRETSAALLVGAAVGLVASAALVKLVRAQLFGIAPHDPTAMIGATLILVAMATLASYLPAARASRIDPMTALRNE